MLQLPLYNIVILRGFSVIGNAECIKNYIVYRAQNYKIIFVINYFSLKNIFKQV